MAELLAAASGALAVERIPAQASTPGWSASAARARACAKARREAGQRRRDLAVRWSVSFLDGASETLLRRFERWASAFFLFAWIMLFTARRQLRKHARDGLPRNPEITADLRTALALRAGHDALEAEAAWCGELFGTDSTGSPEEWERTLDVLQAAQPALLSLAREGGAGARALEAMVRPGTPDGCQSMASAGEAARQAAAALRRCEERVGTLLTLGAGGLGPWSNPEHPATALQLVDRWSGGLRRFREWCLYRKAGQELAGAGIPEVATAHQGGLAPAVALPAALEKSVLTAWQAAAVDAAPALRDFDARQHGQRVVRFRELDRAHLHASARHVLAKLEAELPSLRAADVASSEPALLMREAQKKSRHLPIRKLLQGLPGIIPRLKPCFLMSPLSVAQYLPAEANPFDLVVFDEASQICTHDAIGAIARGRQVIIVGDSRQLPPTTFFTRTADRGEELPDDDDVVELESVLDEAVAKLVPQQWLGWHYRSQHDALIDFSNTHIYEGRLDVFPAAQFQSDDLGISWQRVADGTYQGGSGGRTNRREAEALVRYLVDQLRRREPGERTFGVVTFNQPQQMLVLDLLDEERVDAEVERHFTTTEPVFVKNLENVQGDERDEILFSICYAPDRAGRFPMSFGPLNLAGGERRLNVAVTRARRKLTVFSSIDPEQIDRGRTKARGAWLLREFLQYARERGGTVRYQGNGATLGAQERAMAEALRSEGLEVDAGVGCGGYRLDLAVRDPAHPGRYGVAVESDGPAYRSAASARDRDRLRAEVLGCLGWRLERVWSSSWWYDPDSRQSLVQGVKAALAAPPPAAEPARHVAVTQTHRESPPALSQTAAPPRTPTPQPAPASPVVASVRYESAVLAWGGSQDEFLHASADRCLREQVLQVVRGEGPVHEDVLTRRVSCQWGFEKLTANPRRRVGAVLEQLERTRELVRRGAFVWPAGIAPESYRDFRGVAPGAEPERDLSMIAPEEVANAAAAVLREVGSLDRDALSREVARVFGIRRLGANVREGVERGLQVLLASKRCVVRGERVQLAADL